MGSPTARAIDVYINYGDFDIIKNYFSVEGFLDSYEFYSSLRKFKLRIDSVNLNRKNKIEFAVKGYEPSLRDDAKSIYEFTDNFIRKTRKEKEYFFVNERDSLIASRFIEDSKNYPDAKILMFYGQAHLNYGLVNKKWAVTELPDSLCINYFLGHYLKNYFGKDNIVTVEQGYIEDARREYLKFKNVKDLDILIHFHDYPFLNEPDSVRYYIDYNIIRRMKYIPIRPVYQFYCRSVIEEVINELKYLDQWQEMNSQIPDDIYNLYNRDMQVLNLLTGIKFKNSIEADDWIKNYNSYDGLKILDSKEFGDSVIAKAKRSNGFRMVLNQMGWDERIMVRDFIPEEKDWLEAQPVIKFMNCIGIYWVGYPEEKIKAKEYLVKFSGQDFAEPEKYLQWYRMKYYGYEY